MQVHAGTRLRQTTQERRANDRLGSRDGNSTLQQRPEVDQNNCFGAIASSASAPNADYNAPRLEDVSNLILIAILLERGPQILTHDTRPIHGQNSSELWLTGFEKDMRQKHRAVPCCEHNTLSAIVTWDLDLSKL